MPFAAQQSTDSRPSGWLGAHFCLETPLAAAETKQVAPQAAGRDESSLTVGSLCRERRHRGLAQFTHLQHIHIQPQPA